MSVGMMNVGVTRTMRITILRRAVRTAALFALGGAVPSTPLTSVAAQPRTDTLTSSFTVDGVNVILRRNAANNVVVANLYLLGGTRQVTDANAGIESLLLAVSERGTRRYPKAVIRRKM